MLCYLISAAFIAFAAMLSYSSIVKLVFGSPTKKLFGVFETYLMLLGGLSCQK